MKFIESIKLKDGMFYNLPYHQARLDKTQDKFFEKKIILEEVLSDIPSFAQNGLFKCRIVYGKDVESIEFTPYSPLKKKKVGIVSDDSINYSYKFADRSNLEKLIANTDFDDIIIVKNGFVTDALFSNLVFESSEGLFTPTTYLLPGTKRQFLLDKGIINERKIRIQDLEKYDTIRFINAMIDLEDEIIIPTKQIIHKRNNR